MNSPSHRPPPPLRRLLEESDIDYVRTGKLFIRLSMSVVIGFILWQQILNAAGILDELLDPVRTPTLYALQLGILLGWLLLYAGMSAHARYHLGEPRVAVHAVVQYFSISFVTLGYTIGLLSMPAGVFLLGAPMLGFVLSERHYVLAGLITAVALMLGLTVAAVLGWIPYAPMLAESPMPRHSLPFAWALSQWVLSLPFAAAALYLSTTLLARWKERERHIMRLSISDTLTDTFNRSYGIERLREEMERSRGQSSSVSIVMVDLDHFKGINDRYGHLTGDDALRRAARALKREVRTTDVVCRYGGEEFLLILPDTDLKGAEEVAERCRAAMEVQETQSTLAGRVVLTASLGVATYDPERDQDDEDRLLHTADEALYAAKSGGRNQVVLAS